MRYEIVSVGRVLTLGTFVGPLVGGAVFAPLWVTVGFTQPPATMEFLLLVVLAGAVVGMLLGCVPGLIASLLCVLVARQGALTLPAVLLVAVTVSICLAAPFQLLSYSTPHSFAVTSLLLAAASASGATMVWVVADALQLIRPSKVD